MKMELITTLTPESSWHKKINESVEWEMVRRREYYGTLKSELESAIWSEGRTPILDIDVKG